MPFATIAPISVGIDKDMARACDAIGPFRRPVTAHDDEAAALCRRSA